MTTLSVQNKHIEQHKTHRTTRRKRQDAVNITHQFIIVRNNKLLDQVHKSVLFRLQLCRYLIGAYIKYLLCHLICANRTHI